MMSGDNFTDGSHKTRSALRDVTNRPGKRGVSLISDDLGPMELGENSYSIFAKKLCQQVENLVKESCKTKCGVDSSEKGASMSKDKQSCGSSSTATTKIDNTDSLVVSTDAPDNISKMPDLGVTIAHTTMELGDALRESCVSVVSVPTCSKKESHGERTLVSDVSLNDIQEGISVGCVSGDRDLGVGRLFTGQCGSTESSMLNKSQGSRLFELERCVGLKGDACVNVNAGAGAELLNDCSCSFCLKAAYIWSDLHYQDIKSRIAVLKKSQKEASILVQKCGRAKETDIPGLENSQTSSKIESDLMNHWRSLFLHMEDMFVCESNQLQAGFTGLKNLRENCSKDLERTCSDSKI